MQLGYILLQTSSGSGMPMMIMMVGIFVVMYVFMVLPQQRKQKENKKFIDSVQKGDDIVTIGGIHGKVQSIDSETITISVDKSVKLVLEKNSIHVESSKKYKNKATSGEKEKV